jgi:hypothetical protein
MDPAEIRVIRLVAVKEKGAEVFWKNPPAPHRMILISVGSISLDSNLKNVYVGRCYLPSTLAFLCDEKRTESQDFSFGVQFDRFHSF